MKGWPKPVDNWIYQHRALSLLLAVLLTLALVSLANWLSGSDLFRQFFFPKVCDKSLPARCDPLDWKDLFQAAIIVLGLPVAFLLWHWRDTNVRDQIEEQRKQVDNARKDINLKEFQEVQLRAAGALDENLPKEAREQLQIAALHQLRGFLRGDYGESFKRPAFEILWPFDGLSKSKVHSFSEWLTSKSMEANGCNGYTNYVDVCFNELDRVAKARISILHDDWKCYFQAGFPLNERDFSFVRLPMDADLSGLNLSGCRFVRGSLDRVKFDNTNLNFAIIDHAFAAGASFKNAHMFGVHIECSGLMPDNRDDVETRSQPVDLQGANLNLASIRYLNAPYALLQGASLPRQQEGLSFENAVFDDDTQMSLGLGSDKETTVKILQSLGAKHKNEVSKG